MPLLAVVPLDDIWIVANYKETQLKKVKHGQQVTITADMYADKKFKGTVDSIMAGTGTIFSLFPPENATGNYVKVVQRIPVKITFDKESNRDHVLRVGMSVVPTIIIEQGSKVRGFRWIERVQGSEGSRGRVQDQTEKKSSSACGS